MDIDGQHDKADPYGVRADAKALLALHAPDSKTGCCGNCGRFTTDNVCDAPEVLDALRIIQMGRPEYRVPGANHRGFDYVWA